MARSHLFPTISSTSSIHFEAEKPHTEPRSSTHPPDSTWCAPATRRSWRISCGTTRSIRGRMMVEWCRALFFVQGSTLQPTR
ncbi:hypothetical protein B0H12DRAFT_711354 [Mycena haematopus]|nr:hypothetical protein B0H12DRAFT_711354 [Mycena haematopus]